MDEPHRASLPEQAIGVLFLPGDLYGVIEFDNDSEKVRMSDEKEQRFQELLPYYDRLVRFIRQLGFDAERARDLAQDVFVRVYEHVDAYRGDAKWSYLQTVARHLAYNAIRDGKAAKRNGIEVSEESLFDHSAPRAEQPDAVLRRKETARRLHDAIEQLDDTQKVCVKHFYMAENSYEEVCEILGISLSALKSRLNAARKRLRALLGEEPPGWRGDDS